MDAEYGDSAMGVDTGMLGSKESGRLRAPARKDQKVGLSKRQKTSMAGASSGATNGLSSSLVFTPVQVRPWPACPWPGNASMPLFWLTSRHTNPLFTSVQGLELVNPNAAADRVKLANQKWFNANSGFLSAAPPK